MQQVSFTQRGTSSDLLVRLARMEGCRAPGQLGEQLAACVQELGFHWYHYNGRFRPTPASQTVEHVLSNYPAGWQRRYRENGYDRVDPIWQHTLKRLTPVIWDRDLSENDEQRRFFAERESHGLRCGISFPIFSPSGDPGIFSIGSSDPDLSRDALFGCISPGTTTAQFLHDSMFRITRETTGPNGPSLTRREVECLRWVAKGKTTYEISRILELSEHGVMHHVRNVMRKFGVSKRHHAVIMALSCGFL